MPPETKSVVKATWAAKHANTLLAVGSTVGLGLMAWLFSTVNSIENQLIRMNTEQAPLYAELLHHQDEVMRLQIRVLAQEQAMRTLGYPVPKIVTDDAAAERKRTAEVEAKLKEAQEAAKAAADRPLWKNIFGVDEPAEVTVDQSDEAELPQQVTLPNKPVDNARIKRYMDQVQQMQQQQTK